ncbi:MAG: OmpA family protein, partial [Spirochaetia bacterium]
PSTPPPAAETAPPRPATPPPAEAAEAAKPREYRLVVYFRPDSAEITADAGQELRDFAAQLPDIAATRSRISGHTAIAGPPAGRLPLSRRRAEAVSAELLTSGVQFGSDVQIRGFGGREPVTRNPELQDNNRRVEVNLRYPPSNLR